MFILRTYGRTELALLYNPTMLPGSAYRKLRQWIAHYPGLQERLDSLGQPNARLYTPRQVEAIVEALGEP